VQYGLAHTEDANTILNLIIFDELDKYNSSRLHQNPKRNLKKAQKHGLYVMQIKDPDILFQQGYSVYLSFYRRTGYAFDRKRLNLPYFKTWVQNLFQFQKIRVLGVFHDGRLLSFEVTCLVEDVLILKTIVNSEEGLNLKAPDIQLHHDRIQASRQGNIRMIYDSLLAKSPGQNHFKCQRGARVWCLPARLEVPAPVNWVAQKLLPNTHRFLTGWEEQELGPWIGVF
jgi:hypothetical protein